MKFLFGNAMWHLVVQSDAMSTFVLLILLTMSILCWAVMLYKLVLLRIKKNQIKQAVAQFKAAQSFDDILTTAAEYAGTFPGYLLSSSLVSLKSLLAVKKEGVRAHLNRRESELLSHEVDQTVSNMMNNEESYLSILSASAAIAPLLGLFGTVWGLVDAFIRISQKQNADIAFIAPGIAEALVTTLAGLMVAIPALAMVYYLNAQIRSLEMHMFSLADRFMWIVHRLFGDHQYAQDKSEESNQDYVNVPHHSEVDSLSTQGE